MLNCEHQLLWQWPTCPRRTRSRCLGEIARSAKYGQQRLPDPGETGCREQRRRLLLLRRQRTGTRTDLRLGNQCHQLELPTPISTSLGWCALAAVGAVSEPSGDHSLEFFEDAVQAQAAPAAFGVVRRSRVMKRWAAVTRVTWRCQPVKVRPSKWERPSPVLSSR
jgi:hypothetical protein